MYTQAEINKKKLEAIARKNKNLANKSLANKVLQNKPTPNAPNLLNKLFSNNSSRPVTQSPKSVPKNHIQGNRFNPIAAKPFYGLENKISIKTYMISAIRFAVETSNYSQECIDICKTVESRAYDMKTRMWNFHVQDYDEIVRKLAETKKFTISGIPYNVLKVFRNALTKKDEDIDISRIEPGLIKIAKPFQIEGIKYGISKNGRVLIADDMGLGKTIQALGIADYYKDSWPLLIVTPSSIRYQWTEAIYNHLPSVPAQRIQQVSTTKDFVGLELVTIMSYDLLSRMIGEIEKKIFGVIIIDESHFLKSHKTMRSKAMKAVAKNANHIILLSGTPALSRPIELYTQVALIKKDFMQFHEYGKRYCAGEMTQFGWNYQGSSNMQELQEFLKLICLIRRMKSDVLTQLPEKLRQVIILDPHEIKIDSKKMKKASEILGSENVSYKEEKKILLQYYSDTAEAKIPAVCKYITDLIESGRKFLVFAHHKKIITAISKLLDSKKIRFIKIDGETNSELRTELVNKFQNDSSITVAVLSITAANAGLNLTAACLVVFAELTWNPGILIQAEDRVHRIGQTNNVVIQYLIARKTADDHLWSLLKKKMEVLKETGLKQEFSVKDVNISDQKPTKEQLTLHDIIQPSTSTSSKSESFEKLLDNDDGFDNIDLDEFV